MNLPTIWELWPHVEELETTGRNQVLRKYFDSEFCGIHPEEAEELRKKDYEYLKAVNIVPIRHCILTTKSGLHFYNYFRTFQPHHHVENHTCFAF